MRWNFWSVVSESLHQVTILFSDRGVPRIFCHMNGYGSHTYKRYNQKGDYFWVQYHFKTDQGIKNLTLAESKRFSGEDPNHTTRDKGLSRIFYPKIRSMIGPD